MISDSGSGGSAGEHGANREIGVPRGKQMQIPHFVRDDRWGVSSGAGSCSRFSPVVLLAGVDLAAPGTSTSLQETVEAIQKSRVATRILFITAHPDDESSGLLAYLSHGLGADVALLTITRGQGGQNAIGPEQDGQLGVIRTTELLAADRVLRRPSIFHARARQRLLEKPRPDAEVLGRPARGRHGARDPHLSPAGGDQRMGRRARRPRPASGQRHFDAARGARGGRSERVSRNKSPRVWRRGK